MMVGWKVNFISAIVDFFDQWDPCTATLMEEVWETMYKECSTEINLSHIFMWYLKFLRINLRLCIKKKKKKKDEKNKK